MIELFTWFFDLTFWAQAVVVVSLLIAGTFLYELVKVLRWRP